MRRAKLSIKKENLPKRTPEKAEDPSREEALLEAHDSARMPAQPSTTVKAEMDDESYFINIQLLENIFGFFERKGAREVTSRKPS